MPTIDKIFLIGLETDTGFIFVWESIVVTRARMIMLFYPFLNANVILFAIFRLENGIDKADQVSVPIVLLNNFIFYIYSKITLANRSAEFCWANDFILVRSPNRSGDSSKNCFNPLASSSGTVESTARPSLYW